MNGISLQHAMASDFSVAWRIFLLRIKLLARASLFKRTAILTAPCGWAHLRISLKLFFTYEPNYDMFVGGVRGKILNLNKTFVPILPKYKLLIHII
jgi:hypothetical protein